MNVSSNLSGTLFITALSSLGAANKQQQLAMTLIEKTLSGLQPAGAAQSSSTPVTSPDKSTGSIINIQA